MICNQYNPYIHKLFKNPNVVSKTIIITVSINPNQRVFLNNELVGQSAGNNKKNMSSFIFLIINSLRDLKVPPCLACRVSLRLCFSYYLSVSVICRLIFICACLLIEITCMWYIRGDPGCSFVQVSNMRGPLRHTETAAPPLAAAQLPSPCGLRLVNPISSPETLLFFVILSYFTSVMIDSLKNTFWKNCVRI